MYNVRENDEMTLERACEPENLTNQLTGLTSFDCQGSLSNDFEMIDDCDYDNPVFKLQDELHDLDMDSLGMSWNMFY